MQSNPIINFINIEDSTYCNMKCPYCKHWKVREDLPFALASVEVLEATYEFAANLPNDVEIVHLTTEPLLNWENIKIATQNSVFPNITHSLYTNGLLLDKEKIDFCLWHNMKLAVSFDGLLQDNRMPNTQQLLENKCREFPYCFTVLTTICKKDILQFHKNIEYLLSLPVISINLTPNHYDDWTQEDVDYMLTPIFEKYGERELEKLAFRPMDIDNPKMNPQAHRLNGLAIKTNGDVYQHVTMWDQRYIGSILTDKIEIQDLQNNEYYNPNMDCDKCIIKQNCKIPNPTNKILVNNINCYWRQTIAKFSGIKGE